jgi:hypothetical protein
MTKAPVKIDMKNANKEELLALARLLLKVRENMSSMGYKTYLRKITKKSTP